MDIWRIRPRAVTPEQLTQQSTAMNYMTALDSRTLLYMALADDGSGPWLWMLDVERKLSKRVATGLEVYTHVSASRDGRRIVATVGDENERLWSVPLLDRPRTSRTFADIVDGSAHAPRFGGTSLFYLSAGGSGNGLWRAREGDAAEIWKSDDATLTEPPAVSPDGRQVAVVVREKANAGSW